MKYLANLLTAGDTQPVVRALERMLAMPTTHREYAENAFDVRGGCGFSFGNGCSDGASNASLFGGSKRRTIPIKVEAWR